MTRFRTEPPAATPRSADIGVLLCNLGTPAAPTARALRPYLAEFLSDPRVIEMPRVLWWPILHGIILRRRPRRSAEKYKSIWPEEGSPLAVWTHKQEVLLRGWLAGSGHDILVRHAMRYGEPTVAAGLDWLKAQGCGRVLVLPLYPQYSAATVGSVMDSVADWVRCTRNLPELRFVRQFAEHPGYVGALADRVQQQWRSRGRPDRLLMSFHGIPRRMSELGDPYRAHCERTARAVAARLGLATDQWVMTFQSRFGPAKWLTPATADTLEQLGKAGLRRVDVICPGFVSDCLETLEEIAIEGRRTFHAAGGGELNYIPCLNDQPEWIAALGDLVLAHVRGWPDERVALAG